VGRALRSPLLPNAQPRADDGLPPLLPFTSLPPPRFPRRLSWTADERHQRWRSQAVTASPWITMVSVMAFVWGGFAWVLVTAVREEARKSADG